MRTYKCRHCGAEGLIEVYERNWSSWKVIPGPDGPNKVRQLDDHEIEDYPAEFECSGCNAKAAEVEDLAEAIEALNPDLGHPACPHCGDENWTMVVEGEGRFRIGYERDAETGLWKLAFGHPDCKIETIFECESWDRLSAAEAAAIGVPGAESYVRGHEDEAEEIVEADE